MMADLAPDCIGSFICKRVQVDEVWAFVCAKQKKDATHHGSSEGVPASIIIRSNA
jgi:hypothetical protein